MKVDCQAAVREALDKAGLGASDLLIVGASGGCDSMTLLHLLHVLGQPMVVAHANYGKRGADSDADEALVRDWCAAREVPFASRTFHVAPGEGQGFQGEARRARHEWFTELLTEHNAAAVATGHHGDDQAETFLLHAIRGLDPTGLCAMTLRDGHVVRPLLALTRADIESCAEAHGWAWREDQSNAELVHLRNQIRHKVMPLLESIQPGTAGHIRRLTQRMDEWRLALDPVVTEARRSAETAPMHWSVDVLKIQPAAKIAYREALKAQGWSDGAVEASLGLLDKQVGAQTTFGSSTMVRERDALVLVEERTDTGDAVVSQSSPEGALGPVAWSASPLPKDVTAMGLDECWVPMAWLPVTLRPWEPGDRIQPLGMAGHSNVSDVLTQGKVAHRHRHAQLVLVRGNDVLWVPGLKRSERAKLSPSALSEGIHFRSIDP